MSYRIKRKKITRSIKINQKQFIKLRFIPWVRTPNGCVWLASMALCRSKRQVNDWLQEKKNKRARQLKFNLTGKDSNRIQAIGVRVLREWINVIPPGDSLAFRCDSAKKEKQFRVWKKWFTKNESSNWIIEEDLKTFFYYKPIHIE